MVPAQWLDRIVAMLPRATLWPALWPVLWPGLWRDRRAVTSIEYVIIALIIAVAIVGGLGRIGGYLSADFNNVSSEL